MAHPSPHRHHGLVFIGLVLGIAFSVAVVQSGREHTLAEALPSPWVTACLGLAVVFGGWVIANAMPRFTSGLALAALPGAIYGSLILSWDDHAQLSYGWSAIPIALGCLALGASIHAAGHGQKPWSARRGSAPRIPRARAR
jgi:hypothetical protein